MFTPLPSEGLDTYDESDISSIKIEFDSAPVISTQRVLYALRHADRWTEAATETDTGNQYEQNEPTAITAEAAIDTHSTAAAVTWAQRQLIYYGAPVQVLVIEGPWKFSVLNPSDQIRVDYDTNDLDIDAVFEVLDRSIDLAAGRCTLILGNLHNYNSCGFLVNAADTLPARFGGGALVFDDAWPLDTQRWALQNAAFITTDAGSGIDTESDTFQGARII